ncbi:hypothetical protein [Xenorhabdus lircayensis]|uniref:Uncharacterized protein n=1 Tax=Xenorhabdus lircayensis TaxID=2763499 RepID=A0ABS0U9J6_9GAMM|nr:hypothetical protein [Xenorhabdus lircayensis]MBI6550556.1 hypothetical protein [Xenorhabdus lircayensis]
MVVGQTGLRSVIEDRRIENIRMDGEYLKFDYNDSLRDFTPFFDRDANFYIQVCGYPKHTSSFGIKLAGMNGVSTIAD